MYRWKNCCSQNCFIRYQVSKVLRCLHRDHWSHFKQWLDYGYLVSQLHYGLSISKFVRCFEDSDSDRWSTTCGIFNHSNSSLPDRLRDTKSCLQTKGRRIRGFTHDNSQYKGAAPLCSYTKQIAKKDLLKILPDK